MKCISFITVADFQSGEKIINNEKLIPAWKLFLRLNTGKLIAVIPYFHRPKFYVISIYIKYGVEQVVKRIKY